MSFLRGLLRPNEEFLIQAARYLVVGGLSFLADASTLWFASRVLGTHYLLGNALGFASGVYLNYVLSVRWVFSRRTLEDRRWELALFVAVGLAGLVWSELLMALLVGQAHLPLLWAKAATAALVLGWNFGVRKVLLFNDVRRLWKREEIEA